ncbi:glycosyltransferase [Mycolicibacterium sp. CBM1]
MTDHRGTFEHALLAEPRPEHGYCTDDMARVLVVATRQPNPDGDLNRLAGIAVRFLGDAQALTGACRNRMDTKGKWTDKPSVDDCWGRCVWGLGTAVARSEVTWVRKMALVQFERATQARSPWPRATAYSVLGAAEVLTFDADHTGARKLITEYAMSLPTADSEADWPWPEPKLTYANAVLPEAMIAAGIALEAPKLWRRGLDLLAWLLESESAAGHLSPTPVAGRGPGDPRPAFDQQPVEVATLADACARAAGVDAAASWPDGIRAAAAWFEGLNDAGQVMWDPATGGGFDGLHASGVNPNQGAESTLAVLSTLQHARRISLLQR